MLVDVNNQAYIFLCIVFGSMIIGLTYDLFRVARKTVKTNNFMVHFEDIIFWIVVSILIFAILFLCNAGEIRGYSIIGIILGIIIYELIFSHYVVYILIAIINTFKRILYFIYKILKRPAIFIFKIICIPFELFKKFLKVLKKLYNLVLDRIKTNIKTVKDSIKKY